MKQRILVLGGSGMLGSMVTDYLARDPELEVTATVRSPALRDACKSRVPEAAWILQYVLQAGFHRFHALALGATHAAHGPWAAGVEPGGDSTESRLCRKHQRAHLRGSSIIR